MGCVQSVSDKSATGGLSVSYAGVQGEDAAQAAALVCGTAEFTSLVELSLGCRNLPKLDIGRYGNVSRPTGRDLLLPIVFTRVQEKSNFQAATKYINDALLHSCFFPQHQHRLSIVYDLLTPLPLPVVSPTLWQCCTRVAAGARPIGRSRAVLTW